MGSLQTFLLLIAPECATIRLRPRAEKRPSLDFDEKGTGNSDTVVMAREENSPKRFDAEVAASQLVEEARAGRIAGSFCGGGGGCRVYEGSGQST